MRRNVRFVLVGVVLLAAGLVQAYPGMSWRSSDNPYPKIVDQVFYHVDRFYVEPERANPRKLVDGALSALETQYPAILVHYEGGARARIQVDEAEKVFDLGPLEAEPNHRAAMGRAATVLKTVLAFVEANLKDEVERKDLYYFALNGALTALDPHSNVFAPKHFKEFMINTRGTFGGIGFVFGIRDGDMTIITPIEGTPADRGGLRSGDKILYIDGEPTINMAVDVAANKMRGEPGTQVTLTIAREGWLEPKAITFTREVIHVDSVESYVLDGDGGAPVLYARVKNFQKDTTDELREAVEEAERAYPDLVGVVLDLRNNPGGLLEQAIALSDGFLDGGTIVSTRGPNREDVSRVRAKRRDPPITRKDLVLLVNQGSASASEIVTGALKDSRALVIGQKTFGKGSVQKLFNLSDGGALKLTVAQYLTPGDISIQSIGVQPDVWVYPARIDTKRMRIGPPPEHTAEAALKNAFKDWGNSRDKPWAEVEYLEPVQDEEENPRTFAELGREEKLQRLAEDFQVRLARRVLARAAREPAEPPRVRLRRAAEAILDAVRREEEDKIARRLAELGVDWSAGTGGEGARLQVVPRPQLRLEAGRKAAVTFSVRNTGSEDAFRVWGRTDSANPLVKNLDFVFGKIPAGGEGRATVEVEVPKSVIARWDEVTLKLAAAGREGAGEGAIGALTVPAARPDFVYAYRMADLNPADPAKSGDGTVEEGERVRLELRVRNRGEAASETAEVNIRGDEKEELYLEAARRKLDALAPGAEQTAPMEFRVVRASEDAEITVGVAITDREFSTFFTDKLTFSIGKPYSPEGFRAPPVIELPPDAPLTTGAERVTLELRARDDGRVKDFYAYRGEKKIHYLRNRQEGGALTVRLEVPLEEGSNRIVLAARDDEDLLASRTVFIYRTPPGGPSVELGMK
ncbi:MAG: hypothetical protein Kow0092_22890 [Deferrisomatales bacterium]